MIKVQYNKEIHIVKVDGSIEAIKSTVSNIFKALPPHFHFTYRDQDNDPIVVNCQSDFQLLLEKQHRESKSRLKLEVVQTFPAGEDMQGGIQLLGDGESSVELLEEGHQSESNLIDQDNTQLFQSIEYQNYEESVLISEQSKSINRKKQQEKTQEQSQNTILRQQVDRYLQNMYQDIQEKQVGSKKQAHYQNSDEIAGMIERSLSKLLPKFIKRVSEETIKTVNKLIRQTQIN